MPRCIYCKNRLEPDAIDGKQPSLEHIIQYALGGSNALTTRDACNRCNSRLGETVDSDLINQPIMGIQRLMLGLESQSGAVPDLELEARSLDTGEPGTLILGSQHTVDVKHEPVVIRQALGKIAEELLVAADPNRAREIADGLVRKARKNGKTLWTKSGRQVSSADDLIKEAESEFSSFYKGSFSIDLNKIARGASKIAFGFAHVVLGETWTFSSAAEPLRLAATGQSSTTDMNAVVSGCMPAFRRMLIGDERHQAYSHVVAVLPGDPLQIFVSMFNVFHFMVNAGPISRDRLASTLLTEQGNIIAEIDPKRRTLEWRDDRGLPARLRRVDRFAPLASGEVPWLAQVNGEITPQL